MISDTTPKGEALVVAARRAQTADQHLDQVFNFTAFVQSLEIGVLRRQNPEASWGRIRALLVRKRYWDLAPNNAIWPDNDILLGSRPPALLLDTLERLEIDYVVGGGIAIGAHGEPRRASDVDLQARCNVEDDLAELGDGFCLGVTGSLCVADLLPKLPRYS